MDLQRTLNVLEDIQRDEAELNVQNLLTQLRDLYTQNPEGDAISSALTGLMDALIESRFNDYTPSNLSILESIKGDEVNANFLKIKIETIVQNAPHPKVVADKLSEIVKDRKQFLQEVSKSLDGLHSLGFSEIETVSQKSGEVGIRLPASMTQNDLSVVTSQLEDWNELTKQLHELCGEGATDAKITSVSNGSIWVFFQEPLTCLALLSIIINQLAGAVEKMQKIQMNRNNLKDQGLSDEVIKQIIAFETEESKKNIDKIVDDIFTQDGIHNYPNGDGEEAKQRLRRVVNKLARAMQNGLAVEVTPPKPPADLSDSETDEEKIKKHKLLNERISTVRGVLDITRDIAKGAIDFSKVLLLVDSSGIEALDGDSDSPSETGVDDVGGVSGNIA